jgi:hypothetical protein
MPSLIEILQGTNIALHVLRDRLIVMVAMLLTFALFATAMWLQTQFAIIIACAWAVLVFLPVLYKGGAYALETQHQPANDAATLPTGRTQRAA